MRCVLSTLAATRAIEHIALYLYVHFLLREPHCYIAAARQQHAAALRHGCAASQFHPCRGGGVALCNRARARVESREEVEALRLPRHILRRFEASQCAANLGARFDVPRRAVRISDQHLGLQQQDFSLDLHATRGKERVEGRRGGTTTGAKLKSKDDGVQC